MKPSRQPVWNTPHRQHLTKMGAAPFLCLVVWTWDVNEPVQVLSAGDGAEREGLPLG